MNRTTGEREICTGVMGWAAAPTKTTLLSSGKQNTFLKGSTVDSWMLIENKIGIKIHICNGVLPPPLQKQHSSPSFQTITVKTRQSKKTRFCSRQTLAHSLWRVTVKQFVQPAALQTPQSYLQYHTKKIVQLTSAYLWLTSVISLTSCSQWRNYQRFSLCDTVSGSRINHRG